MKININKRIISMILVIAVTLTAMPVIPAEVPALNSGWHFDSDTGTLTVTTNAGTAAWRRGMGLEPRRVVTEIENVVIESSVTVIGEDAFWRCTSLTSVTIPDSVTVIEQQAFFGCTGLTTLIIGENVTRIGDGAFFGCVNLTSVTFRGMTPPQFGIDIFGNEYTGDSMPHSLSQIEVPAGASDAYRAARAANGELALGRFSFVSPGSSSTEGTTSSPNPPWESRRCGKCRICESGSPPVRGRVSGWDGPTILCILEILMYLIGMDSLIARCSLAHRAALVSNEGAESGEPTIFCVLEIFMYLCGMESRAR